MNDITRRITRRNALKWVAVAGAVATTQCAKAEQNKETPMNPQVPPPAAHPVLATQPLAFPWTTQDPFLFCVHHDDAYPAGNAQLGPATSLAGRNIGQDFAIRDGWRMYHGQQVPGFPQHPHRGFETVTVVRQGLVDHADSLGAAARYGHGDVQWLTAGKGIQHAEMFPLLEQQASNRLELFQIWLNLPRADKMAQPHFTMLWDRTIPRHEARDAAGRATVVTVVAGQIAGLRAPSPPPSSWASRADTDVAIWTIRMEPGAQWTLPAAAHGTNRTLYFFQGSGLRVTGRAMVPGHRIDLRGDAEVALEAGADATEMLLLQGRPIGEPVVQHGPFVMNSREEIEQTFRDYQRTQFGGWPWPSHEPVHGTDKGRFARQVDGRIDRPA